ncbi:MAG: hypothetical protein CL484_10870 [Acidobacteria bacterium]|nr:hypothetical protein [Acidobacteriota bacterium]
MKFGWLFTALVCLPTPAIEAQEPTTAPGNHSIRTNDLEADVKFLASDLLEGRLTETTGNHQAAEFIASRFGELGLTPIGNDDTYYHRFNLVTTRMQNGNTLHISGVPSLNPTLGGDFYPDPTSASSTAVGRIVFVGFGISAATLNHDDYQSGNLEGAVALMLAHEPEEFSPQSPFDGTVSSEESRLVRKILAAQARGAVAVMVAPDLHNHPGRRGPSRPMRSAWPPQTTRRVRYQLADWTEAVRIPVIQISAELTESISAAAGHSFEALSTSAERHGGADAIVLDRLSVEITTSVFRQRIPNRNVVGLVEGTHPKRKNEWIIITAHYDHDGKIGERIFNGADDNASGIAGLLEIADAYKHALMEGSRPERSILFAAWNSEEQGLLGAWAYAQNPLHPLAHTVAVLNMDMIGRDEEIPDAGGRRFRGLEPQTAAANRNAVNILGYSRSPDLRLAAVQANATTKLELKFRYDNNDSNLLRRSDQWPFLYNKVPALFIHTGLHPDYHTERDQPDKLRYEKMTRIVKMVHQLSWNLAESLDRPAYSAP